MQNRHGIGGRSSSRALLGTVLLLAGCGASRPAGRPASSPVPEVAVAAAIQAKEPTVPEGWLGGLREVDVAAPVDVVMGVLTDPEAYRRTLSQVRSVTVVARPSPEAVSVSLVQGTSLVQGVYTMRLERLGTGVVRYQLEPAYEHSVDDAFGFAEVTPRGDGSHLRYFIAFQLSGATRLFFAGKVERSAMGTAERVRALSEERAGTRPPPDPTPP